MKRDKVEHQESLGNQRFKKTFKQRDYYFHPDEDFKVDWDWGKQRTATSRAISKRSGQFEF